jgi:hypothetical protein
MCHHAQTLHSEDDNHTIRVFVTVSKLPEPKSDNGRQRQTVDVKDKRRTVIAFLRLKWFAVAEIVVHLWKVYDSAAYCHEPVFRWITKV